MRIGAARLSEKPCVLGAKALKYSRSAGDERVEHRIDVRRRRAGRGVRADRAVERLVDREVVREAVELREEVAAPPLERRGRGPVILERSADHEVRPDGLVLERCGDRGDLQLQAEHLGAVRHRRGVVEVRRVLADRGFAEERRMVRLPEVDEPDRHLRVEPENGVAHDAQAVAGRVAVRRGLVEVRPLRVRPDRRSRRSARPRCRLRRRAASGSSR